jgi:hypothetical protein
MWRLAIWHGGYNLPAASEMASAKIAYAMASARSSNISVAKAEISGGISSAASMSMANRNSKNGMKANKRKWRRNESYWRNENGMK